MATRHKHLTLLLALILAWGTLALYWQVKEHEFITYDDYEYIVQNPLVVSGIKLSNLGHAFTTAHASNCHPLTWISHMLDAELFGMNPAGHHLSNLALHIAATLLLFLFLRQTTGAIWRSFLVAALFAVHPLHVESVAWTAERKDVLSALFWMLTLLAYRRYAANPRVTAYLLTLVLFVMGLLSKPMVVTLPFVLLLLDFWPLGRLNPMKLKARLLLEKVPFLLLSLASSLLTFFVQRQWGAVMEQIPLSDRITNAMTSYMAYLLKTFWPHDLAFYYPHPLDSTPLWKITGAVAAIGMITWISVRTYRTLPFLAVGWFWYLGTMIPVIGIVQVGGHGMADRYTYLPLIGIFIALSWSAAHLAERWRVLRRALPAFFLCSLLALSIHTWHYVGTWKDSITVYSHAIRATSGNFLAHNNLGNVLARQGKLLEAEHHLREALRLNPANALAQNNLGMVLVLQGRAEEGVVHFRQALRIHPGMAEARFNLESALRKVTPGLNDANEKR